MKKYLAILIMFFILFSSTNAYNLTNEDIKVANTIKNKIEISIKIKWENYRTKYIDTVKKLSIKYKDNEKIKSILDKIAILLNNQNITYKIVDTWVIQYYDNDSSISKPSENDNFYWQDANYQINNPSYTDNNDGTLTDNVTWLMWQKDMWEKISYRDALKKADELELWWYDDWRVPTIKELYSLIQFTGKVWWQTAEKSFIDTTYFKQPLGDTSKWEREIDAQTWSSTKYVWLTMNRDSTIFWVNFIDGRIKWYPELIPGKRTDNKMYFRMVRWNKEYGKNNFIDNWDWTISDLATWLMWQKDDSKKWIDWKWALEYVNDLELWWHSDWRLPNAKELQSIVDYSRSPQTTNSAAIDEKFDISSIIDPKWKKNYPFFWTSTTHLDGRYPESSAIYICFWECQWKMNWNLMDVHWAWAQRSDPKSGNAYDYPQYFWPQWDIRYVFNYARAVRNINY